MKKEEKEIKVKVIEEIRLKKAEIRKFKRGRGGKSGRTPGRVRKAAVFAAALAGLSLCFSREVSAARPGSSTSVLIFSSSGLMEEGEPVFGFRLSADTRTGRKKWSFTPNMKSWAKRQYRRKATFGTGFPAEMNRLQ